jgi:ATP/maltotriose-dependent transcriptional regulator MalT
MLAWVRAFAGHLAEARTLLYERDPGTPPETWAQAGFKFWTGQWLEAQSGLAEDADERDWNGDRHSAADDLWLLAKVQRARGGEKDAEAHLQYGLEVGAEGHVIFELRARAELALLCAEAGRTREARAHLERCESVLAAGEDWRGVAGRVALAAGALAAAEGRSQEADGAFARAVEVFRRVVLPWDEAEALKLWGRYLLQAHRRDDALERLNDSLELYRRIDAGAAWIDSLAAERDAALRWKRASTTAIPAEPNGLSAREMDVLRLIAGGRSNREIAETLFVSARTVERHIANIYGKLDLHSRTQATAYAFAHDLVPSRMGAPT